MLEELNSRPSVTAETAHPESRRPSRDDTSPGMGISEMPEAAAVLLGLYTADNKQVRLVHPPRVDATRFVFAPLTPIQVGRTWPTILHHRESRVPERASLIDPREGDVPGEQNQRVKIRVMISRRRWVRRPRVAYHDVNSSDVHPVREP